MLFLPILIFYKIKFFIYIYFIIDRREECRWKLLNPRRLCR